MTYRERWDDDPHADVVSAEKIFLIKYVFLAAKAAAYFQRTIFAFFLLFFKKFEYVFFAD